MHAGSKASPNASTRERKNASVKSNASKGTKVCATESASANGRRERSVKNVWASKRKKRASRISLTRFDSAAKKRKQRIKLQVPALSIDAVDGKTPLLLVVNIEGSLDIYDASSGKYLRSIHELGDTPYMVHRME